MDFKLILIVFNPVRFVRSVIDREFFTGKLFVKFKDLNLIHIHIFM